MMRAPIFSVAVTMVAVVLTRARKVRPAWTVFIALTALIGPAASAPAGVTGTYGDNSKDFKLTPNNMGAVTSAVWSDFEHVWINDGKPNNPEMSAAVRPGSQQGEKFSSYGTDFIIPVQQKIQDRNQVVDVSIVNVPRAVMAPGADAVPVVPAKTTVLDLKANPNIFNPTDTKRAPAELPTGSKAQAVSSYMINRPDDKGALSGKVTVSGNYKAGVEGYAFSYSRIDVQGNMGMAQGKAAVLPQINAASFISPQSAAYGSQPVAFKAFNPIGQLVTAGMLLDISYDIHGPGSLAWDGGQFAIDASNADVHVSINPDYVTSRGGVLDLQIRNGVFTVASDTIGLFSALPALESPGSFQTQTASSIDMNYDLGNLSAMNVDAISIDFDAGAGVLTAVPEPSTLVLKQA